MQINLFLRKIHEKHTYIQAHVVGRLENLMNGGGMFDDVTSYHFLARFRTEKVVLVRLKSVTRSKQVA